MTDIIIIGGGPAGISAGLTAKNRGKSVKIISNPMEQSGLWKAGLVENYPGLSSVTGPELLTAFSRQSKAAGVEHIFGRALSAVKMGTGFGVTVGQDYYDCRALIFAIGITQQFGYPGEQELLGKGVSYCATCDGMLYRGRKVAVIGLSAEAAGEAEFLRSIGCQVEFFGPTDAKKFEILGDDSVKALIADGREYLLDGVFILRNTIAPASIMAGLETENGHMRVNQNMETTVPGTFACGDCIGRPYQIARATGQGNTAALAACEYLQEQNS